MATRTVFGPSLPRHIAGREVQPIYRRAFASQTPFPPRFKTMTAEQRARARKNEQDALQARAMERNFTRDWKPGDVYAPHDLSAAEARKWRTRASPHTDAFDALSLNPVDLYKNFSVMSEYMTDMGRIRHSHDTGLRPVNQRKIAKAIRRAIGIGLMPAVHKHPKILEIAIRAQRQRGASIG